MPFWYNGWLVALADILAGCLVLTSLARQDVKHTSADLIAVRDTLHAAPGMTKTCWPVRACLLEQNLQLVQGANSISWR